MNKDLMRMRQKNICKNGISEAFILGSWDAVIGDEYMELEVEFAGQYIKNRIDEIPYKWFKADAPRVDNRRVRRYRWLSQIDYPFDLL